MDKLEKYDAKTLEQTVRDYWKKEQVPQKLASRRKGAKKFYLLDGPPYVNASAHVGHVKTTTCKDIWTRFKYMQGYDTHLQAGFDCHGLPVEVMVEKELGVKSRKEVEEMGLEKFDSLCLEKVENNEKKWMAYYEKLGAWRAYFEPYFTYKPYYIESAWWTLKQLHEKGFLVEGEKPIHWCPHCETALSGYEVSDSYKDVTDPSVFLKYKVAGKKDEFLLVWTTTPWTTCANVCLAVHPDEFYVKAKVTNPGKEGIYILAEKRVKPLFEQLGIKYEIIERFKGKTLDGLKYEPIIDVVEQQQELAEMKGTHRVYMSIPIMVRKKYKKHETKKNSKTEEEFEEFVTMTDGTGLVHSAPGHGQSDYNFGRHYGLPAVSPVDEKGCFTEKVSRWKGKFVKQADKEIIEWLDENNKLFHAEKITHSYPLCWRCKSPLVFRLSAQWYLSIESIKEKMLAANGTIGWMPEYGEEAFGNWIAAATDWCVSQQRFWGMPMPIWRCDKCGRKTVIGSVDELRKAAAKPFGKLDDLHRHTVDKIEIKCECGANVKRIKDIFNVWFDSSIAPWASLGYPYRNKELFEQLTKQDHLVDLINESQDQIRGWFYVLSFTSMATFNKKAFDKCSMMGWVVDAKGDKMSKSVGNVIMADEGLEKLGADAIRLYYCWEIAPWDMQKFSFDSATDVQRALNILWNTFVYYDTYKPKGYHASMPKNPEKEDEWLLSRVSSVTGEVTGHMEKFEFHHAGRKIISFAVDDFSRWYVKLVRDRASEEQDKRVFDTMHYALENLCKLLAPIAPFITDYVYQQLGGKESVHYQLYPAQGKSDLELEKQMAIAMAATEAVNSARKEANIKLRWPVKKVVVTGKDAEGAVKNLKKILQNSMNSLEVSYSANEPKGQFLAKPFNDGVIYLDASRDEELNNHALFRELVRAIQASRKENGFDVKDFIALTTTTTSPAFGKHLAQNEEQLKKAVNAKTIAIGKLVGEYAAEAALDELKASAKYSKV